MSRRRVHLVISGLVQGVSYRASAQDEARGLSLAGWVRNLPSGDVEAVAEGPPEVVERFVAWCRRGPSEARVTGVALKELTEDAPLPPFQVRR